VGDTQVAELDGEQTHERERMSCTTRQRRRAGGAAEHERHSERQRQQRERGPHRKQWLERGCGGDQQTPPQGPIGARKVVVRIGPQEGRVRRDAPRESQQGSTRSEVVAGASGRVCGAPACHHYGEQHERHRCRRCTLAQGEAGMDRRERPRHVRWPGGEVCLIRDDDRVELLDVPRGGEEAHDERHETRQQEPDRRQRLTSGLPQEPDQRREGRQHACAERRE
jgi:hypothetical protein